MATSYYRAAFLETLPTLSSSQTDDLKIEEKDDSGRPVLRVWLCRLTRADGYTGPRVTVEAFDVSTGRWHAVR